ncbi:MAG: hypothetical protein EOO99_07435 [Pedobacter sp.]|nr:MAG: hypothetical protein EOO99_07435 [Pedobacter sp.]
MERTSSKKICLITPGHISSNPRLVKEAIALSEVGYKVHIIFTQNLEFLVEHDARILNQNPHWTFDVLSPINKNLYKSIFKKLKGLYLKILKITFTHARYIFLAKHILNKNYTWQLKKAINNKADLYIAHNLGALPIAVEAAKYHHAYVGFDAEDYHRHEITNDIYSVHYIINKIIEDYYIPKLNYLTGASPLIVNKYAQHYPQSAPTVINNVFSIQNLQKASNNQLAPLSLFWFSQTIGKDRGLEDVIHALNELEYENIKLILLGNISDADKYYFLGLLSPMNLKADKLEFINTVQENQLYPIAAQYDIGLVLERKEPENKNICLSNKSFTYLLAGLTTISTDTAAQRLMLAENPGIGKIYQTGDIQTLVLHLKFYLNNRDELYRSKLEAQKIAKEKYNWEIESQKFIHIIHNLK